MTDPSGPPSVDEVVLAAAAARGPGAEFRPLDLSAAARLPLSRVVLAVGRLVEAGALEYLRAAPGGCLYRLRGGENAGAVAG